jgi:hypothetical protein
MYYKKTLIISTIILGLLITISTAKALTDTQSDRGYTDDNEIGMDYDGVNPGNDKNQCLSYEQCPEWDGNPDTKVFYDLMKEPNGTGIVETDFNYNLHVYLCIVNKELDSINGEGAFEKRAIQSAKDGWIPCPIGVHPNWDYDWESHILDSNSI